MKGTFELLLILSTCFPLGALSLRGTSSNQRRDQSVVHFVQQKFQGSEAFGQAGTSVAINSDATVYAYGIPNSQFGGSVRVFRRRNQGQEERSAFELLLEARDYQDGEFGMSMSMTADGNYLVVGAPGVASVQVFYYDSNQQRYVASGLVVGDEVAGFGESVSATLDPQGELYFAVGSPTANDGAGSVSVYKLENGTIRRVGQELFGANLFDRFGTSVDVVARQGGFTLGVGAPGSRVRRQHQGLSDVWTVGRGYVYELELGQQGNADATWQTRFTYEDLNSCGDVIDLSPDGNNLIIGCPDWETSDGYNVGRVFVFYRSGATFVGRGDSNVLGDDYNNERFGQAVKVADDGLQFIACMSYSEEASFGVGACQVYRFANEQWTRVDQGDIVGTDRNEGLGDSMAATGDLSTIILGARGFDDRTREPNLQDAGRVWLFHSSVPQF